MPPKVPGLTNYRENWDLHEGCNIDDTSSSLDSWEEEVNAHRGTQVGGGYAVDTSPPLGRMRPREDDESEVDRNIRRRNDDPADPKEAYC